MEYNKIRTTNHRDSWDVKSMSLLNQKYDMWVVSLVATKVNAYLLNDDKLLLYLFEGCCNRNPS
jgi:hypothetical protein